MKKLFYVLGAALIITSCNSISNSSKSIPDNTFTALEESSQKTNDKEIESISEESVELSKILITDNKLIHDLNKDGKDDTIQIDYVTKEGSQYISKFEILLSGVKDSLLIEDYDASFERLETIDLDNDDYKEILLMFNTHGSGGQGTHDLYILSMNQDTTSLEKLNNNIIGLSGIEEDWHVDDVYYIDKVIYNGNEELMLYQYVWGKDGHSDQIGDIVSIAALDKETNQLTAKQSWVEFTE